MRTSIAVLAASAVTLTLIPPVHAAPVHAEGQKPAVAHATPPGLDMSKVKTPALKWAPCEKNKTLLCTVALLPLDYSKPDGPKIAIGMSKSSASGKKKGTIFVNPGGPGSSASVRVPEFAEVLGKTVTSEYDVIGVDPRGIGASSPAACWSNAKTPAAPKARFPLTAAEQKEEFERDAYRRAACDKTGRPIIDHMSTASTARDMEMIRRAVGDKQLNYYGVSYGSYLGATYAALFPHTVGRMAVDSVLDPVAYSTGRKGKESIPSSARVGSGEGAQEALKAAFAECKKAGPKACPHGDVIEKAWTETLDALKKAPVKKGNTTYTYQNIITETGTAMYDSSGYTKLINAIHEAWQAVTVKKVPPTKLKQAAEEARKESMVTPLPEQVAVQKERGEERPPVMESQSIPAEEGQVKTPPGQTKAPSAPPQSKDPSRPSTKAPAPSAPPTGKAPAPEKPVAPGVPAPNEDVWSEKVGSHGVLCSDTTNPSDPQVWAKYANSPEAQKNPFLGYWVWASSSCANWPGKDKHAYRGPFDVKPANPLLILNNTHDPSTPLENAKALNKVSPGSRLVTVEAWGHGSSFVSSCAHQALENFLLKGALPKEGLTCKADKPLFAGK
ncbi:alpha/beta fold hydrolase [Austwickia chelonae]|uniref:alpha/beta fold hydrolase n=1 Tax=Austwickia chelonae TaxID=100225 RepID=UPI001F078D60|nr:alpha/beta fold hydrolase [Austwickia chelonae]